MSASHDSICLFTSAQYVWQLKHIEEYDYCQKLWSAVSGAGRLKIWSKPSPERKMHSAFENENTLAHRGDSFRQFFFMPATKECPQMTDKIRLLSPPQISMIKKREEAGWRQVVHHRNVFDLRRCGEKGKDLDRETRNGKEEIIIEKI